MVLCSSVIVGDSGIEARVGSWLTRELIVATSLVSLWSLKKRWQQLVLVGGVAWRC